MKIVDTFGNTLAPGSYFTYATGSRYAIIRIGRVPVEGEKKLKVAAKCWSSWDLMQGPRPSDTVLALDAAQVPDSIREMLA